ncbi:hypothetical protein IV203_026194 [Nitzschia inconspicua]|uniref:Uncharacterized protein n=1 Tax=Nitzschia inconspicua TaxID=303405 RepID=A0A9K3PZN8_9STRA|nr:hypothetical protein IV203_026194 [Nitzschia inconspicua]
MLSASAIPPPSHLSSASLLQQHEPHQDAEWPALSSPSSDASRRAMATTTDHSTEDWELLHPEPTSNSTSAAAADSPSTVRIVEPAPEELQSVTDTGLPFNTHTLKHCQSSPDLRKYVLEDDEESSSSSSDGTSSSRSSSSGVLVQTDDGTTASSSVVMVPSLTSAKNTTSNSPWASKVSFKETLMKQYQQDQGSGGDCNDQLQPQHHHRHHHHHHRRHTTTRKKMQPKFVVVQPKPLSRGAKSTGDLQSLDHEEDDDIVLGDTDAQLYYNQKAQGQLGRRNGRKQRPDEAKRLDIIMAKKSMQRERTNTASSPNR